MRWWRKRGGTWWWAILVIALPVAGLTVAATWIVSLLVDATTPRDRLEVIRTALAVGAGSGGIIALVLAGRRQWSTEQANNATEHDATERRITDLYMKAVDQLGSDHAAIRLGGLFALERLASAAPTQRATIGEVICAYLRMPHSNPPELDDDASESDQKEHDRLVQEREARQTALDIISRHNNSLDSDRYWPEMSVRLERANLSGTNLRVGHLNGADLNGANLTHADLTRADLNGADLNGANLTDADLNDADLNGGRLIGADLIDADLTRADLNGADLTRANLTRANLNGANLTRAILTRANLNGANLFRVKLFDANLLRANLNGAILTRANLTRANLIGADLTGADLTDADLTDAVKSDELRRP